MTAGPVATASTPAKHHDLHWIVRGEREGVAEEVGREDRGMAGELESMTPEKVSLFHSRSSDRSPIRTVTLAAW